MNVEFRKLYPEELILLKGMFQAISDGNNKNENIFVD